MSKTVVIDGKNLCADAVVSVARHGAQVRLSEQARVHLRDTRDYIETAWFSSDAPPIYAFNTGVGQRKNIRIDLSEMEVFQINLMKAAAAGAGDPMPAEVVRAMLLLRINAFATNHSGVRTEIVDRLIAMLNAGITPVVAAKGSVGASGDLAPLALMSAAMIGAPESRVAYRGEHMPAPEAFQRAGLPQTIDLKAKDTAALINGATASLAYAVLVAHDARHLLRNASVSLCLSLEALRAETACFEDRMMLARAHPGQRRIARSIRQILGDSQRCSEPARAVAPWPTAGAAVLEAPAKAAPRIQDAYSLRCAPQVHGPVLDALEYIDGILATEMNSATDNPLIFKEEQSYSVISGGNFHGQYIAQAMDLLALVLADLSAISDRRSSRLVDPACNFGLPAGLSALNPGVNPGLAGVQSTGTGLVLENTGLCSPASVISLPAKANTEDHISNSCFAARRTRTVLENTQTVIAIEMLLAANALDIADKALADFALGTGTDVAWKTLRDHIPVALGGGRWVGRDIEQVRNLVTQNTVLDRVQLACGSLLET